MTLLSFPTVRFLRFLSMSTVLASSFISSTSFEMERDKDRSVNVKELTLCAGQELQLYVAIVLDSL